MGLSQGNIDQNGVTNLKQHWTDLLLLLALPQPHPSAVMSALPYLHFSKWQVSHSPLEQYNFSV